MKKAICLILSLVCAFTLVGCGKDNDTKNDKIDLAYYAKLGQMPEAKYTLGANPDQVIDELDGINEQEEAEHQADPNDTHGHDEEEFYLEVVEGEKNVLIDNGNICYYYTKANKDKGVSLIVSYGDAFGFSLGTVILELKNSLPSVEFTEEELSDENAFFASYVLDGTVLKAEFENSTILFVFQENELFATAIYNENWIS
jgi:hypothetical protein